MNINATLLAQAGNFFIAYLLFYYILLKPGYAALREKELYVSSFEDTIEQDVTSVEQERERRKNAWDAFRAWCNQYRPESVERLFSFRGLRRTVHPTSVSDDHKKEVKQRLKQTMRSQIEERYE